MKTRLNGNKKNAKVLLVQPNYSQQKKYTRYSISPPLGLAYIAATLEKNGICVEILDANALNLSVQDVVRKVKEIQADIVGVSILMTGYKYGVEIARKIPKNILSVCGGAYPSSVPEQIIKDGFDIAVKGRGEQPMLDLALGKKIEDIPGIYYQKDKKINHNPPHAANNLKSDPLPLPARHLLINNGVNLPYQLAGTMHFPWSPIFTSIGCPYQCYYCSKQVFDRFMPRSPEDIFNEIEFLVKQYQVKEIDVYDDCFNADANRAEKILDLIIESGLNIKLRFPNGIRANNVNELFIKKMKKAGCVEIAYGIESGNQGILDKIPKALLLEDVRKAVQYTKKENILTIGFFILGLRGDNEKSMQETIDFAKELSVDVPFFSILTPYPGTPLWKTIEEKGEFLIEDYDDLHQSSGKMIFSHPDFPSPELVEKMYKKAYREIYFSFKYIFQTMSKLTWKQFVLGIRGLPSIIKNSF